MRTKNALRSGFAATFAAVLSLSPGTSALANSVTVLDPDFTVYAVSGDGKVAAILDATTIPSVSYLYDLDSMTPTIAPTLLVPVALNDDGAVVVGSSFQSIALNLAEDTDEPDCPGAIELFDVNRIDDDGNGLVDDFIEGLCPPPGVLDFASHLVGMGLDDVACNTGPVVLERPFVWSSAPAVTPSALGAPAISAVATAMTPAGDVVVGVAISGWGRQAMRWRFDGASWSAQELGDLRFAPSQCQFYFSQAFGVSAGGTLVVGESDSADGRQGFVWSALTGMMLGLGDFNGPPFNSTGGAISANELVIVGSAENALGQSEACRWVYDSPSAGWIIEPLGILSGGDMSRAVAVSADGDTIVGVGTDGTGYVVPFIWDPANGIRNLQDVMVSDWGLGLPNAARVLTDEVHMSADARTIVCFSNDPSVYPWWAYVVFKLGNTPPGTNVPTELDGGVRVTFDDVTVGGETTVSTPATCPMTPPSGFQVGDPPACFELSTSATFSGPVEVCFRYEDAWFPAGDSALILMHDENIDGDLDDTEDNITSSLDTVNNIICGVASGFSPFVIAAPADSDSDGLSDVDENTIYHTNPNVPDTDADGLLDGTEVDMAMGGGCPNPIVADSDCDTLSDGSEVAAMMNPCNADTDGDGVADPADPLPTQPGVTGGWLEQECRDLADPANAAGIPQLELSLFDAPNSNAAQGRRNALANRAADAANAIAAGDCATAIAELQSLLDRIDDQSPPSDWIVESPQKTDLAEQVELLISLLQQSSP